MSVEQSTGYSLDVTAIVVSYNSADRIESAVGAHETAMNGLEAEILVVDNASSDNSVERARSAITRGRVIANSENVGYGHAVNQGIRAAKGRVCWILNDDARMDRKSLRALIAVLSSSDEIALIGPRIVDDEGNPMPSARMSFPGPSEELERAFDVLRGVNRNNRYPIHSDSLSHVAWLVAACVIGKTDVLQKIGGFSPAFFLYSEDIDLCRRLTRSGYRVATLPEAVCVHTGSVSTSIEFGEGLSSKRRTDARDIYYRIWFPRLIRSLIHLRRAIGFSNQPGRLRHHLPKVLWDGTSLRQWRSLPSLTADAGSNVDKK